MQEQKKVIDLITISGNCRTRNSTFNQLKEYVPDGASLESYCFEEGIPPHINAKVLLLTGESFAQRLLDQGVSFGNSIVVIAKRTLNLDCIELLVSMSSCKNILVVNDSIASAMDAIENFQQIGFSDLNYIPFSPEVSVDTLNKDTIFCTLSVGEGELVPKGFDPVYEIGTRGISGETIAEVWGILGWGQDAVQKYINNYLERVISTTRRTAEFADHLDTANKNLFSVIDAVGDSLILYEPKTGLVIVANHHFKKFSSIEDNVMSKHISQIIKNELLVDFLLHTEDGKREILTEWNGKKFMVSRLSITGERNIGIFRSMDDIQTENSKLARHLVQQGFYSKYSFDDIRGISKEILETKALAQRLAHTDLNILIEGESGTGKELFAAAIHQESSRHDKPYVAINFSSINDSLMESELFGYEEGAFTGARRGGKAGVFEMANGGTIFLDEIGDISPKMQVGLLRVLQENEVMRIGGGRIRHVDLRIIAATNQNLQEKVRRGTFREDLYYRLKIGYLHIPPLRARSQDIAYLTRTLLDEEGGNQVDFSLELIKWFEKQPWHGNVRELKNIIIYMNALRTSNTLDFCNLPDVRYFQNNIKHEQISDVGCDDLLSLIEKLLKNEKLLGRRLLLEEARKNGLCQSEYALRKKLGELESRGCIIMGKGKIGIKRV